MKKILTLLACLLACAGIHAQGAQKWLDPEDLYNDYTTIYFQLSADLPQSEMTSTEFENLEVGAFIDGDCRGQAFPTRDYAYNIKTSSAGNPIYMIMVRGNLTIDTDEGKTITFKVHDTNTGFVYPIEHTEIFDGKTHGEPWSNPSILLSVKGTDDFYLNFSSAEVGQTYNLLDYVITGSTDKIIPENVDEMYTFTLTLDEDGGDASEYANLAGTTLIIHENAYDGQLWLHMNKNNSPLEGSGCSFRIMKYATGINLLIESIDIDVTDTSSPLSMYMMRTVSYDLDPSDANNTVKWEEKEPKILTDDFKPTQQGTTYIRPYAINKDNSKLYPAGDKWIEVNVIKYVNSIAVNPELFDNPSYLVANVGDTKLLERLVKIITWNPADASNQKFTLQIDNTDIVNWAGTSLKALQEGIVTLTITPLGTKPSYTTSEPYSTTVQIRVKAPTTEATFNKAILPISWSSGATMDITNDVISNVVLNGTPEFWPSAGTVALSGDGNVTCADPHLNTTGLGGTYTATGTGTTTVTINFKWIDYDAWLNPSDAIPYKNSQSSFQIKVYELLYGFNVTVTNAVAGKQGTITFSPLPESADISNVNISITNNLAGAWLNEFQCQEKLPRTTKIEYEYSSKIPGYITVSASGDTGALTLYESTSDPTTSAPVFTGFEVGWPFNLNAGWQWRSIPWGAITTSDEFKSAFGVNDLSEIRTSNKLLYNDPEWGFFGTLNTLQQGQCFKVNMKQAPENANVLHATTSENIFGTLNTDGTNTITLKPGWTWIGSPYFYDHQFDDVFDGGTASTLDDGAIIIGKTGFSTLTNGVWVGNETIMKAGEGYVIKNPSAETKTITFKSEYNDLQPSNDTPNAGVKAFAPQRRIWEYDHTRFMNNMNIVAELEGVAHPEQYSIGAFVGDECRGEGVIMDGKAFITVHCDNGEPVSFKLYSPYTNDFYTVDEGVKAVSFLGSMQAPFKLHATGVVDGINTVASPSGEANAETYDLSGRRVNNQLQGVGIRRTADGKVRKVIIK